MNSEGVIIDSASSSCLKQQWLDEKWFYYIEDCLKDYEISGHEPHLTEYGIPVTPRVDTTDDPRQDDETLYEIERIVRAERIGNKYRIWIKWVGYDDITYRYRHELVTEISDPDILKSIDDAVEIERSNATAGRGVNPEDDEEPDQPPPPDPPVLDNASFDEPTIAQRIQRRRSARMLWMHDVTTTPTITRNALSSTLLLYYSTAPSKDDESVITTLLIARLQSVLSLTNSVTIRSCRMRG